MPLNGSKDMEIAGTAGSVVRKLATMQPCNHSAIASHKSAVDSVEFCVFLLYLTP